MSRRMILVVVVFFITVIIAIYMFPYLYLVLTSLKPRSHTLTIPPSLFPSHITLETYRYIGKFPYVIFSFINSIIIAVGSTIFALILSIPAAYAITRYRTMSGRIFMIISLCSRMIPYVSIAIPFFIIMKTLHLVDTHVAVMFAHSTISLPLAIWLMASFFEGVPRELDEAARIDGCSRLGALVRVIAPISISGIAVTAIFCFLLSWNEFLFALLLTSLKAKTVPITIADFKTQYTIEWGAMCAVATLFSLPGVIFSLFMQKRIVAGITLGALKQ